MEQQPTWKNPSTIAAVQTDIGFANQFRLELIKLALPLENWIV